MLFRGKVMGMYETDQMRGRVQYLQLGHAFVGNRRVELKTCGHCGARLYLEGLTSATPVQGQQGTQVTAPKKQAKDVVNELGALASLKSAGVIDSPELKRLKDTLFAEM